MIADTFNRLVLCSTTREARGQDRAERLREMSEAEYALGAMYTHEAARRSMRNRSGRMRLQIPREIWRHHDIEAAGVGVGCLVAMQER